MKTITKTWLQEQGACGSGADWFLENFPRGGEVKDVIAKLERADWLIWFLFRAWPLNRAQIVTLALVAARRAFKYVR